MSHIFLVWLHYLLNWHVMLLELQHGELMMQLIHWVRLLEENLQDIVVMEQTYWLIVQWTTLSIFVCLLQMMMMILVIQLMLLLLVSMWCQIFIWMHVLICVYILCVLWSETCNDFLYTFINTLCRDGILHNALMHCNTVLWEKFGMIKFSLVAMYDKN